MRILVLLVALLSMPGCPGMVPHTEAYTPGGPNEKSFIEHADFSIFPNEVRKDLAKYKGVTVAWTGIVTDLRLEEPPARPDASFWFITAEHHYYDWLVDFSIQQERYFLSPLGEGKFTVIVPVKRYGAGDREKQVREAETAFAKGNMVWAYGHPDLVEGGVVRLNGGYANSVDAKWFTTKILSYDRVVPDKKALAEVRACAGGWGRKHGSPSRLEPAAAWRSQIFNERSLRKGRARPVGRAGR